MKNLTVLTGAGISAESGIRTFRSDNGLWEGHDVMEVASPQGWHKDQELVLDFYNKRRRQLHTVEPNTAHKALAGLENYFHVNIITQNVDDLHERAGSQHVTHLHGNLFKVRSTADPHLILDWKGDLNKGDLCKKDSQLRPHVVWFGEPVPLLEKASEIVEYTDILLIIGTSLQVYPAAGLMHYAPPQTPVYLVDPNPAGSIPDNVRVIPKKASEGVPELVKKIVP